MSKLEDTIEEVISEGKGTKAPVPAAKGASSPDKDEPVKSTQSADKAGDATSKANPTKKRVMKLKIQKIKKTNQLKRVKQ